MIDLANLNPITTEVWFYAGGEWVRGEGVQLAEMPLVSYQLDREELDNLADDQQPIRYNQRVQVRCRMVSRLPDAPTAVRLQLRTADTQRPFNGSVIQYRRRLEQQGLGTSFWEHEWLAEQSI